MIKINIWVSLFSLIFILIGVSCNQDGGLGDSFQSLNIKNELEDEAIQSDEEVLTDKQVIIAGLPGSTLHSDSGLPGSTLNSDSGLPGSTLHSDSVSGSHSGCASHEHHSSHFANGLVVICHKNKRTLRVPAYAVRAHLRQHGDSLGSCQSTN